MDNPKTLATLGTQGTARTKTNKAKNIPQKTKVTSNTDLYTNRGDPWRPRMTISSCLL